jgi:hypothetical protein
MAFSWNTSPHGIFHCPHYITLPTKGQRKGGLRLPKELTENESAYVYKSVA